MDRLITLIVNKAFEAKGRTCTLWLELFIDIDEGLEKSELQGDLK